VTSTSIGTTRPAHKLTSADMPVHLPSFRGAGGGRRPGAGVDAAASFSSSSCAFAPVASSPPLGTDPRHAPLGNTRNMFPAISRAQVVRAQRRARRRRLRDVLWHRSGLARCRGCGRRPIGPGVSMVDNGGVAHYRGLMTCGSIWACPVCAAKIRNARALEIAEAAGNWHRAGNTVLMVTFTMPHEFGMPLADLLPTVTRGFRSVISGRAWLRVKDQVPIVGQMRSIEVTHGPNGWHPHAHSLVFIEGQADAVQLAAFGIHARAKWARFVTRAGYRVPSDLHGVKIDVCTSAAEAGLYIAKTQDGKSPGNELARADLKSGRAGHRTPFEVLGEIADTGDLAGLPLWLEYEQATKGHQAITWSAGLRKLLLGVAPERTDEEIAAEEVGGGLVLEFTPEAWRVVTRVLGLETMLLEAFEQGGPAEAVMLACRYGLMLDSGPPGPVPRLVCSRTHVHT
jgi:hypothetical protein